MRKKVSEYIVDFLVDNGITQAFSVTGGGAMHLNDAFGNHRVMRCMYNHHEQACAMAAESYARVTGKIAAVCVTSGPGGTNAITGVLCGYQDGIPMLVVSGQIRYDTTVESTGLNLRQFGEQEYPIIASIKPMTKYAVMVIDPDEIKYHLQKALYEAYSGRPGPCWIDVPLNVQNSYVETDSLKEFVPPPVVAVDDKTVQSIVDEISRAKFPVILAGSGVRQSVCGEELYALAEKLGIPILCATLVEDIYPRDRELYFGNFGVFGGRAGNFIVQRADLLISFGCRLSFKQIGFNYTEFSKNSRKVVVDVDSEELKKPTMKIDVPVPFPAKEVVGELLKKAARGPVSGEWLPYCKKVREDFPLYLEEFNHSDLVNPYYFSRMLWSKLEEDSVVVLGNGSVLGYVSQFGIVKKGQRLCGNINCGPMGYDLPAAVGACVAANRGVYCVTGEGSIQMNLQELQTIVHNKLKVKIIVLNNFSYQCVVLTQNTFFDGRLCGCTAQSGIGFPDFQAIASAYGMPYVRIENHAELDEKLDWFMNRDTFALCEIIQDTAQPVNPRTKSRITEDGKMESPPIDDLFPFLPREVYKRYTDTL